VPEGDALHRAARRLQTLVGERLAVETPHPRAQIKGIAERLDGRVLESVEAVGKNLLLRFEGGVVLRSHLRMQGRWRVQPRGSPVFGRPWLVLRGARHEALQFNGPVLELGGNVRGRLGPDVLAPQPDLEEMLRRLRGAGPSLLLGEALLRQRLVAGIGNMWMAEALWAVRLSPWTPLGAVSDEELLAAVREASRLMRRSLDHGRDPAGHAVYRRAGRACRRCGTPIRSRGLGDENRTAYWCPVCQPAPA
jgi:endonuclease VIII